MSHPDATTKIKVNHQIAEPPMYRVIYLNDNTTSIDFVISSLIEFFDYNQQTAMQIATDIHEQGSAIVAVLAYELAEQKGIEVTVSARTQNFPLMVKLEPDNT
jgi:ATP-dependent Clp protease adaptor protein ClpS